MRDAVLPLGPGWMPASGSAAARAQGAGMRGARANWNSLRNDRRGLAALEFALVTPLLLLMIFVMLGMGLYMTFVHEVQELASSAARSSVAGLNDAERASLAQQFVANSVSQSALLNAADVSLQTQTSGTPATNYSVTVSYTLKDTPIPALSRLINVPLNDISRTSTIEFGGY